MSRKTFLIIGSALGGVLLLCVVLSLVPIRVTAAGTGKVEQDKWAFITPRAVDVVRKIAEEICGVGGPVRVKANQPLVYLVDDLEQHNLAKANSMVGELQMQEAMFRSLLDGMEKVSLKALEKAKADLTAAKVRVAELGESDGTTASHTLRRLDERVRQQRLAVGQAERRARELRAIASADLPMSLGKDLLKELKTLRAKLECLSGNVSAYRLSDAAEKLLQQDSIARELQAELEQTRDLVAQGFASKAEMERTTLNLERARSERTVMLNAWASLAKKMVTQDLVQAEAGLEGMRSELRIREGAFLAEKRNLERLELARARADLVGSELALAKAEMETLPQQGTEGPEGQKFSVPMVRRNVDSTQAALKRARDDLELAKIRLANKTVRAPISGVLVELDAYIGQTLVPDSHRSVGRIIDDASDLLFVVRVPQHWVPMIEPRQEAEVYLDAYPYRKYGTLAATVKEVAKVPPKDTEEPVWEVALILEKPEPPIVVTPGYKGYAEICVDRLSVVSYLLGRSRVETKGE